MEDRILENHVNKWLKSVEIIDANLERLEKDEKDAYTTCRNIFSKKRPNMEVVANHCDTLKEYLDGGVKDNVYTAVRDFLKTTEIAKENFLAFKEFLEDKEFYRKSTETGNNTGFEGATIGTATYRRVEIDGNIYEGMFLGEDRVWKGKINYSNGTFYEGEWGNDGPHGEGVLQWENGTKFTGSFKGFSGTGRVDYPNGSCYEGTWNERGPHGLGIWKIGTRIDKGEYANGCRTGKGRMEWDNGDWYEGEWNEKGANGYGIMKVGNRIDKGEFTDHVRIGAGRMEWDNGDWYEGGWNNNGYHGKGKRYLTEYGRTDEGEWDDGKEIGIVKMKWNNGNTYVGTWSYNERGLLSGVGEYYWKSTNKSRKGKWNNGNWKNDWATTRNIIGSIMFIVAIICMFFGEWIVGIGLGVIGKFVYEGT